MKQFVIYSYHGVCDDWYAVDGDKTQLGASLQTLENTQLYKDAGFNVMFVSYVFGIDAREENFETSKMKSVMDMAYSQGLKCFVHESNIFRLSQSETSLIDPQNADGTTVFASQEELNEFIEGCISDIIGHPAFYGFTFKDEPSYKMFTAMGQLYRAIKSVVPNAFVNINILPYWDTEGFRECYCENGAALTCKEAYANYLQSYYDLIGSDTLQYDDYPLKGDDTVKEAHLINLKMVADFCKEKGITFYKVFQACALDTTLGAANRKPTEMDMYWQMNIGMAMGIRGYSYWSYYPVINSQGEYYDETASFVNRNGEPNELYYIMQHIHAEMQKMAKVLMNFEYVGSQLHTKEPPGEYNVYLQGFENDEFAYAKNVHLSENGAVLVTELKDEEKNGYGYYFVNVVDPVTQAPQTVSVEFEGRTVAAVYKNGEVKYVFLENNRLTVKLECGEGVFVLPLPY